MAAGRGHAGCDKTGHNHKHQYQSESSSHVSSPPLQKELNKGVRVSTPNGQGKKTPPILDQAIADRQYLTHSSLTMQLPPSKKFTSLSGNCLPRTSSWRFLRQDERFRPQNRQTDLLPYPSRRRDSKRFLPPGHWPCRTLSAILSAIIVAPRRRKQGGSGKAEGGRGALPKKSILPNKSDVCPKSRLAHGQTTTAYLLGRYGYPAPL